ncbi:MAG: polysaccharide deacetylase [Clostridia bacterium]|nr:MAG: polysaccharide deacetylase [Clostridia bacterium]
MRIFFFPEKRLLQGGLAGLLLLCGLLLVYGSGQVASVANFQQAIYQGNPEKKAVALTFNVDWGEEYLPQILQVLATEEVKATFFPTGRWTEKFPGILQEIAAGGHEVGNHGYAHAHVGSLSQAEIKTEIERGQAAIQKSIGARPTLFAPPYGEDGDAVVQAAGEMGYLTVMWTVDTLDWQEERESSEIARRVLEKKTNGAIILMHPTARTLQALPVIIRSVREQGYDFLTVSEIIE